LNRGPSGRRGTLHAPPPNLREGIGIVPKRGRMALRCRFWRSLRRLPDRQNGERGFKLPAGLSMPHTSDDGTASISISSSRLSVGSADRRRCLRAARVRPARFNRKRLCHAASAIHSHIRRSDCSRQSSINGKNCLSPGRSKESRAGRKDQSAREHQRVDFLAGASTTKEVRPA
jgi:hypothetical protein